MTDFIIKKLPYDLTSNAGLALVGQYFKRLGINQRIDTKYPISGIGIANSDILKSYLGLLVQGKNDFDAIEAFRGDDFFSRALGIGTVPSSPTLRQRMDTHSADWFELAEELKWPTWTNANYHQQPKDECTKCVRADCVILPDCVAMMCRSILSSWRGWQRFWW